MSFASCSLCGNRIQGKPATAYWAWFLADNKRSAWRQKLCLYCFTTSYLPILQRSSENAADGALCPACGGKSTDEVDAVYLTLYFPKQEAREYELGTDAACAAKLRLVMQQGAIHLEDRAAQMRGPSSEAPDPWAAVELP
jgi:hypothetical protein